MSSVPPDPSAEPTPPRDDTAAFSRFYLGQAEEPDTRGLIYRLFVGWWRDR